MESNFDWVEDCYKTYYKDWLKNARFCKSSAVKGDHDHCLFDAKKISRFDYENSDKQGYYSPNEHFWLCSECFNEIENRNHKLKIIKNTVQMIKDALHEHKTVVISLNNEQYFIKNNGKITVEHNGNIKEYDSVNAMEREQMFYGKPIREMIGEIYLGIID